MRTLIKFFKVHPTVIAVMFKAFVRARPGAKLALSVDAALLLLLLLLLLAHIVMPPYNGTSLLLLLIFIVPWIFIVTLTYEEYARNRRKEK